MNESLTPGRYYLNARELAYLASIARDAPELHYFWQKVSKPISALPSISGANAALPKNVRLTLADLAFEKMKAGQALSPAEQEAIERHFSGGGNANTPSHALSSEDI